MSDYGRYSDWTDPSYIPPRERHSGDLLRDAITDAMRPAPVAEYVAEQPCEPGPLQPYEYEPQPTEPQPEWTPELLAEQVYVNAIQQGYSEREAQAWARGAAGGFQAQGDLAAQWQQATAAEQAEAERLYDEELARALMEPNFRERYGDLPISTEDGEAVHSYVDAYDGDMDAAVHALARDWRYLTNTGRPERGSLLEHLVREGRVTASGDRFSGMIAGAIASHNDARRRR